jgi:hypothetical protein
MALNTYSGLLASVAGWLHRSDLASVIPDFVTLAEAQINRDMRLSQQETAATLTVTAGSAALPSNFLAVRQILTDASPPKALTYVAPDDWARYGGANGVTTCYTIIGDTIKFAELATVSPTMHYYAKVPALVSAVGGVNWLLTAHPDIYLWGTLSASAPYIGNDARLATWQTLYGQAIATARTLDRQRKLGSGMQVRPDVAVQ